MKKHYFNKDNKRITEELVSIFLEGTTFTIRNLMEIYELPQKERWQFLLSKQKVLSWLHSAQRILYKENNVWLTSIDCNLETKERTYGLVRVGAQAEYAMTQYYTLTKGIVKNANRLALNVKSKGLLKGQVGTEELLLPKVKEKK